MSALHSTDMSVIRRILPHSRYLRKAKTNILLFSIFVLTSVFVTGEVISEIYKANVLSRPFRSSPRVEANVFRWTRKGWVRATNLCQSRGNFTKAMLVCPAGQTPIYMRDIASSHDSSADSKQEREETRINLVFNFLDKDSDMGFVDLGCNVGAFSLMAAKLGRKTVAVDDKFENIIRLCKSVSEGGLTKMIDIFFTTLSNRDTAQGKKEKTIVTMETSLVEKSSLDDLLPLINFKKTFVKFGEDQHEFEILSNSTEFFDSVDVTWILMKWPRFQRKGKQGRKLRNLLLRQKYLPNILADPPIPLDLTLFELWPEDVLWEKQKHIE